MKFALSLIALILIALIVPFFIPGSGRQEAVSYTHLTLPTSDLV